MAIAAIYLVAWDYDRLKPILFGKRDAKSYFSMMEFVWLPLLLAYGGAFAASFFAYFGVANLHKNYLPILLMLTAAGFLFGIAVASHHRFMTAGELKKSAEIS